MGACAKEDTGLLCGLCGSAGARRNPSIGEAVLGLKGEVCGGVIMWVWMPLGVDDFGLFKIN